MAKKIATFGGGCFWCTEAIFRNTIGVLDVKSGFSGGFIKNPAYREVCTGRTGHAEVIQLVYDSEVMSLEELITIHLLTHNPTTIHEKATDKGAQYRSIIFYNTITEKETIEKVIQDIQKNFENKITTEMEPFKVFFEAEEKHQNYYKENGDAPYCSMIISPKLKKLKKNFPNYQIQNK